MNRGSPFPCCTRSVSPFLARVHRWHAKAKTCIYLSDATTTLSNELEIKEVYWGHPPPFSGIFTCNLGCRVGH